jgi:hypothetical protein
MDLIVKLSKSMDCRYAERHFAMCHGANEAILKETTMALAIVKNIVIFSINQL